MFLNVTIQKMYARISNTVYMLKEHTESSQSPHRSHLEYLQSVNTCDPSKRNEADQLTDTEVAELPVDTARAVVVGRTCSRVLVVLCKGSTRNYRHRQVGTRTSA